MLIQWTAENNKILETAYNKGESDKNLATYFNTTVYAVAKQRSKLGYVKNKRQTHTRKERTIVGITECNSFVGHYKENGADHFINLGEDESKAETIAYKIICEKRIKNITILRPYTRLVVQAMERIKL